MSAGIKPVAKWTFWVVTFVPMLAALPITIALLRAAAEPEAKCQNPLCVASGDCPGHDAAEPEAPLDLGMSTGGRWEGQ